ncbi:MULTISPECIES: peroxiredoxin [unclassified Janthinobacterium]|uniref:peroxiredoxin family protein n=1 Tax=unclassified Janthinobacterium TaxID=2610881 RepID=UPI001619F4AD|nr:MULTISPECIES: TlpA disulfide reductase family protein [unclassified Janthinobacterium]MBB5609664.1 peroxiredoxin [Janthinobacterium sp. S3T4]MBB5614836.1 peroxiredoxin [Janthinobacterium sp. S3M3]
MPTSTPAAKSWLKPALIAVLVAGVAAAAYASVSKKQSAPDVSFHTISGETITSNSLRGKVVMVNFWATSCTTCVAEMPEMVDTYNKYKGQGLEFVAVAMQYDPANYVLNFAETRQLPFKVALDASGDAAKAYGDVALTPTTFVLDKQGKILKRYVGKPEFAELHKLLETALAG